MALRRELVTAAAEHVEAFADALVAQPQMHRTSTTTAASADRSHWPVRASARERHRAADDAMIVVPTSADRRQRLRR
jgi:hypothetical protein